MCRIFKNPAHLLGLIKKIGTKIDEKIKRGDINETEIMHEATDLMNKMKNMELECMQLLNLYKKFLILFLSSL